MKPAYVKRLATEGAPFVAEAMLREALSRSDLVQRERGLYPLHVLQDATAAPVKHLADRLIAPMMRQAGAKAMPPLEPVDADVRALAVETWRELKRLGFVRICKRCWYLDTRFKFGKEVFRRARSECADALLRALQCESGRLTALGFDLNLDAVQARLAELAATDPAAPSRVMAAALAAFQRSLEHEVGVETVNAMERQAAEARARKNEPAGVPR